MTLQDTLLKNTFKKQKIKSPWTIKKIMKWTYLLLRLLEISKDLDIL